MKCKYSGFLWKAAVLITAVLLLSFSGTAMEMQIKGTTVTTIKEQAIPAPVTDAADAKVMSMPNPVTAYPNAGGYPLVTWETLSSYLYDTPNLAEQQLVKVRQQKKKMPIPGFVTELNNKKIAIVGYLIPMDTDPSGDYAMTFVIVRSQMSCCFGVVPKLNEWVMVTMEKGKKIRAIMDLPTTVFGTFEVGEKYEDLKGWSLYRMTAERTEVQHSIW